MAAMSRSTPCALLSGMRCFSRFAAVCLAAGWLHVWQHLAEPDHGSDGPGDASAACQLADNPPTTLSAAAACEPTRMAGKAKALLFVEVLGDDAFRRFRIRAPPLV